jgi:hypothetical protein
MRKSNYPIIHLIAYLAFSLPASVFCALTGNDTLASGQCIAQGQTIKSSNGQYYMVLQTGRNLVLYNATNNTIWSSQTINGGNGNNGQLCMQSNGNLEIMRNGGSVVWSTNTTGNTGAFAQV